MILLYGEKWSVAGHYFETLLVFFMFLPFASLFKEFLIGSGRIGTVVRIQWAVLGLLIIGVSVSVFYGNVIMVLWTMNLSQVLAVTLMAFDIRRRITVNWFALCVVPVLAFLIAIVVGSWLVSTLSKTVIGTGLSLITLTFVYVALLAVFDHRSLRGEFAIVINGIKRR